jgi:hypothetical protein
MLLRFSRLAILAISVFLLSSMAMADTVVGSGSFQSGWNPSTNGSTFFNNASWDGNGLNIGFCIAGGGNCNFSGQPNSALPVFAGANFSAPGAFYLSPSGGGSANLTLEIAGNAGSNQFGWYLLGTDPTNAANRNVLFTGPQGSGTVSNFNPSGSYGFYILAGGTTLYTSSLFGGATDQHFAVFQQADGSLWIGVEDLALRSSDRDFNDMVIKITPVPEASSMAMLGIGLVALVGAMRKKFRLPVAA